MIAGRCAAHRVAVEWDDDAGQLCRGVYIPRRDTDSRLNALLTSQSFFVTAGAILYSAARILPAQGGPTGPNKDELQQVLLPVAILGAFTASVAC